MQHPINFSETTEKTQLGGDEKNNRTTKNPVVSVVMLVYNGEKYLKEAIDSVLAQTFKDFELLLINDGSTDGSLHIINTYTDDRIRLINNEKNCGIPYSRNIGLTKAHGVFLAWMDCDDLILPTRLEKQVHFLKGNPQYGACGTWIARFGDEQAMYINKPSKDPAFLKAMLLFKPAIPNATVMLRLSMIKEFDIHYNMELAIAEDYDFILKCSMEFPMTILPEVLYKYRASETSIMKKFESQEDKSFEFHQIIYTHALHQIGIDAPSREHLWTHSLINSEKLFQNFADFKACYEWLDFMKRKNKEVQFFEDKTFRKVLAERFYFMSKKASKFGWKTLQFYGSKASKFGFPNFYDLLKLCMRCAIRYNKF